MNNEPQVSNYAKEACIVNHFRNEGIHISIRRWAETATELEPVKRNSISGICQIYEEIDEETYQDWQILRFVSVLLGAITKNDNRHMLISLQAVECKSMA